jgi:hypothetical protein
MKLGELHWQGGEDASWLLPERGGAGSGCLGWQSTVRLYLFCRVVAAM